MMLEQLFRRTPHRQALSTREYYTTAFIQQDIHYVMWWYRFSCAGFRYRRSYTMLYDSGPKTGPFSNGTAGFPANTNCSNGWSNGCPPEWLFRNRNEWCAPHIALTAGLCLIIHWNHHGAAVLAGSGREMMVLCKSQQPHQDGAAALLQVRVITEVRYVLSLISVTCCATGTVNFVGAMPASWTTSQSRRRPS